MRSVTRTSSGTAADLSPPDDELPLLMLRTLKAMVERIGADPEAATSKFTPVHGLVSRYLDGHDDVTVVELAEHLHVTKQSASELVAALESGGYVRRRPNPTDGRSRLVELTPKGRTGLARSRERWNKVESEWSAAAGPDALAVVRDALRAYLDSTSASPT